MGYVHADQVADTKDMQTCRCTCYEGLEKLHAVVVCSRPACSRPGTRESALPPLIQAQMPVIRGQPSTCEWL